MSEILETSNINGNEAISTQSAYDPNLFHSIAEQVHVNYNKLVDANTPLFRVALPKGKLFDTYLANLPEQHRQQMNCSCCRGFLSRFGGLVRISTDEGRVGQIDSVLWDLVDETAHPVFAQSLEAMRALVESTPIEFHFLSKLEVFGQAEEGGFEHFALPNLNIFQHELKEPHEIVADEIQDFKNLSEFVGKTDQAVINGVLTFFKNDQRLKTRDNWVGHIEWLAAFKADREGLPQAQKRAFTWFHVATQPFGRRGIYNSPLGTFIKNVAGGDSYEVATRKFLEMTKGDNYMRPKAAPKAGTVTRAETIFEKMGLAPSLERRFLTHEEIRGKVWTPPETEKPTEAPKLFGHLQTRDTPKQAELPKLPEIDGGNITLKRFLDEVLPEAQELHLLYHPSGSQNFTGFLTAVHPDAKPILSWDKEDDRNPVSGYCYTGGSPASNWDLGGSGRVKVTCIMTSPTEWDKDDSCVKPLKFGETSLTFVLERGRDVNLAMAGGTPMFPETFRSELHEIRSVMEAFFRTKRLTDLQEGQKPVIGVNVTTNGQMALPLLVVKKDAMVRYLLDRSH